LILLFDSKNFYVFLFNKQKNLLTNSFKLAHTNDVVYYVLTTLKQMEILNSEIELFLGNTNDRFLTIKDSLKSYFDEIQNLNITPFLSENEMNSLLKT